MELMKLLQGIDISYVIVIIGAFMGSIKASISVKRNTKQCAKLFDIILGIFCGIVTGLYFIKENGMFLSGLIALFSAAGGALFIEVLLQILPSTVKKLVNKKLNL